MQIRTILVAGAIVALAALSFLSPSQATPQDDARDQPVFAYYYLWWGNNSWQTKLGPNYPYSQTPHPLPATTDAGGCNAVSLYEGNKLVDVDANTFWSLDDPGRILYDVQTAAAAGLKGFIVNWNGTGDPNQTITSTTNGNNQRLDALVNVVNQVNAEGTDFKLWVSYKASSTIRTLAQFQGDLTYFINSYGTSPAFDKRSNKPVFMWTGSRKYSLLPDPLDPLAASIQAVGNQFRPSLYLIGDESHNTWGRGVARYLDGDAYYWSSQNPYTNQQSFTQLRELATAVRSTTNPDGSAKMFFAPLAPGYNSYLNGGTTCVPRNDGVRETMKLLFEGNANSNPDAWAFISWNEIAENTHLVPLAKWGSYHLTYLGTLIDTDGDKARNSQELFMTTNPLDNCNATSIVNDEPVDAWPPDADDNKYINIGDVVILFNGRILKPPRYQMRSDFDQDGAIDIGDVIIQGKWGPQLSTCT